MNIPFQDTAGITGATVQPFAFRGPGGAISGQGPGRLVPRGPAATLEDRIGRFLSGSHTDGLIGGALPFDRTEADYLWLADRSRRDIPLTAHAPFAPASFDIRPEPVAAAYADAVARALRIMAEEDGQSGALQKIVLARTLAVTSNHPIPLDAVLARLSQDPAVTAFQVKLPPRPGAATPARVLLGATPELLLAKRGPRVSSHPLAGSAPRSADAVADAAAAAALSQSDKDRREHAIVVEYILDTLAPYCRDLACPDGTTLTSTRSMWHLGTRIDGSLKDDSLPSVVLAARLHPTPAVCGLPRDRAAELIRRLEPVARDFYAGAVGWCDGARDGAWYVAIRCAEVCGNSARLYAGAGIVPGSDPMGEAAETGAKFGALLAALGLPSAAGLVGVIHD